MTDEKEKENLFKRFLDRAKAYYVLRDSLEGLSEVEDEAMHQWIYDNEDHLSVLFAHPRMITWVKLCDIPVILLHTPYWRRRELCQKYQLEYIDEEEDFENEEENENNAEIYIQSYWKVTTGRLQDPLAEDEQDWDSASSCSIPSLVEAE